MPRPGDIELTLEQARLQFDQHRTRYTAGHLLAAAVRAESDDDIDNDDFFNTVSLVTDWLIDS